MVNFPRNQVCITNFFVILSSKMTSSHNLDTQKINPTMRKFGAPESCIHNYEYWSVILRPVQVTLGSMVLAAYEPVSSFSELSPASFNELKLVTSDLEKCLKSTFSCDKLNYLMLMMVDPHVHFHVIPRYAETKYFADKEFIDASWPGPPDLGQFIQTDDELNRQIIEHMSENWDHRG